MVAALEEYRIVYMAIPKAACTSVKATLAAWDQSKDYQLDDFMGNFETRKVNPHAVYPTTRFRPHRWQAFEGWWRFSVVRDPLKRLLAVYSDRVFGRKELFNSPKIRRQSEFPPDPDPDFFFQNLQSYRKLSSVVKHHALPSRLFIGAPPFKFDKIFPVEHVEELAAELTNRTGQNVTIPRLNKSSKSLSLNDLSKTTQNILAKELELEYSDLSNFYQNPFA